MGKTFRSVTAFFIGLVIGLVAAVLIVEKQFWFWHITKDRNVLILEIRKINLEKGEIDDLIQSLNKVMNEVDKTWEIKEGK